MGSRAFHLNAASLTSFIIPAQFQIQYKLYWPTKSAIANRACIFLCAC